MRFSFLIAIVFLMQSRALADGSRPQRTVCTMTINSPQEIQTFKKKLEPQGFKFVELVPKLSVEDNTGDWFKEACKSGVQCDMLIISGHFSNEFFGQSKARLPLELMQQESCAKTCDGILRKPKEVFLFGCNTLAGKNHENRTPEEYHQALINDGIDRITADERTTILFSSLGASMGSSVQQVFEQVPVINGFDGAGPSGIHVMGDVAEYLKTVGDYQARIDKLEGQKVTQTIEQGAKFLNPSWYTTIKQSNRITCTGAAQQDPQICSLLDEKKSRFEKLLSARDMLNSPDANKYLLAAGQFVADAQSENPTPDEQAVIDKITQLPIKDKILKEWPNFKKSPGTQGQFAGILKLWKQDAQVQSTLIQALSADSAVMCPATASLRGLDNPKATAMEVKIVASNKDSEYRRCAIAGLQGTTNPAGIATLVKGLSDSDVGVRENAADAMQGMKLTPQMETALAKSLSDGEYMVRSLAAKALQGTTNHDAQLALAKLLNDDQYQVFHNAYMSLGEATDPAIQQAIRQFRVNHPNENEIPLKKLDQSSNQ